MSKLPFEQRVLRRVVLRDAQTSPKFGVDPYKRSIPDLLQNGIINIDKPSGPTSHQVSYYVREIVGVAKTGHSGTLDPKVTGVLPVAVGRATRVVQALLPAGKEYVCVMHVHADVPRSRLDEVMGQFLGDIEQMPPVKSAVKRRKRMRRIYYLDTLDVQGADVMFRVGCQAGTYIRKLCHDMGQKLGCGAHMAELRRSKAGPFDESTLCTLQDVTDAVHYWRKDKDESHLHRLVRPMEEAVSHLPHIWVLDSAVDSLCHGASLKVPGVHSFHDCIELDQMVAILTMKGELIAIGRAKMQASDLLKKTQGVAVKPDQVLMAPSVYPKMEK
ncbi:MAG: RNA-guided pseudouridylation complex pseudouridine synthase subunit Cbf5 [Nanoarchaeota archaeon]